MANKIALVTGGSRGLGKDMALALAKKGIDVILTYNSKSEEAEKTVAEIAQLGGKAAALQLNQENIKSLDGFINQVIDTLKKTWGAEKFDFLINNAGVGATLPIPQVTEEAFDRLVNINFKSIFFLTQKALPHINDHGCIIFVSSGTTRFCVFGYAVYASLKGGLEVLTKYVAKESGVRGIRSNIVAPGAIETDFNNALIKNNPQVKANIISQTALGRAGRADDIGSVVAFLCTEDAKWINGQRIEVSGGIGL